MERDMYFTGNGRGVDKRWIYKSKLEYELSNDYIQKLNYNLQDFFELKNNYHGRKDVYYLVQLTQWIIEIPEAYMSLLRTELVDKFHFSRVDQWEKATAYMQALRAILLAHPLKTDRHGDYGFDGDFISVDIGFPKSTLFMMAGENYMLQKSSKLSMDGMDRRTMIDDCEYCIVGYRKSEGARFYQYVGCNISDLVTVVDLVRNYIREFDLFLSKQKKKDYLGE
ncbi:MAG: hypothetical protein J6Y02_12105 [Pseudobutyrivibrio sp.]|nr:hypothetical protein [Pseudobutyrivibrio sp.]